MGETALVLTGGTIMSTNKISSLSATQFITAIAAEGGAENAVLAGLAADGKGLIYGIKVESKDNLPWGVEMCTPNTDEAIIMHKFATTDAIHDLNNDTYMYLAEVQWPVPQQSDAYRTVSFNIRNHSADTAKTAGTNGALTLTVIFQK